MKKSELADVLFAAALAFLSTDALAQTVRGAAPTQLRLTTGKPVTPGGAETFGYVTNRPGGGQFLYAQWKFPYGACKDSYIIYALAKDNPAGIGPGVYNTVGAMLVSQFVTRDEALAKSANLTRSKADYLVGVNVRLQIEPAKQEFNQNTYHLQGSIAVSREKDEGNTLLVMRDAGGTAEEIPDAELVLSCAGKDLLRIRIREGEPLNFDLSREAGFVTNRKPPRVEGTEPVRP